jgi:DNA-directed RNA polymerase subunit N (RpoN/RPB10)
MRINCLSCGHKVDLDDAYDDFEGQIKCFPCGAVLEIKTDQAKLKKIKIVTMPARGLSRSRKMQAVPVG